MKLQENQVYFMRIITHSGRKTMKKKQVKDLFTLSFKWYHISILYL